MNENERRRRWNERLGCWVGPTSESSGESTDPQGASGEITTRRIIDEKEFGDLGEKVRCECFEWKASARQVFTAQIFYTMNTGIPYTGSTMIFCPWCGKRLKPVEKIRGESHTWATVDDIHDSDTPERQAQIRDIMTRNTFRTVPNQIFTGFDPGSPEGDYGAKTFMHKEGDKFVVDKIEYRDPECLCPEDGHSELCPVHRRNSSPR